MADEGVYHEGPYLCPIDGLPMRANPDEIPPPPEGFSQFDHTFTPDQAHRIIELIPSDAHHWADIPRKAPHAVARYTALMLAGRWRNETLEHGFYEHPIRWDEQGRITHGVMRLLACKASGQEFRACVFCPTGMLPEVFEWT
jgi:hypothetical protein